MNDRLNIRKGITAIELLIIVAIVAVLAMIAVPRLIDSQARAKLSRVKSDLRKGKMALEAFHFDHKWYPPDGFWFLDPWAPRIGDMPWVDAECTPWFTPEEAWDLIRNQYKLNLWRFDNCLFLTTPVAYLSTLPKDPFMESDAWSWLKGSFLYVNWQDRWKYSVAQDPNSQTPIVSPSQGAWDADGVRQPLWILSSMGPDNWTNESHGLPSFLPYDPSNGTISKGDIFAAGPQ